MDPGHQDIAIIGSGCRFPGGAESPAQLWEILRQPTQLATTIPSDRFSVNGFYHENGQYHGHINVREGYFLQGEGTHRRFDAAFFNINPAEAKCLDPQIRLLLEVIYEALESGGQNLDHLRGSDTAIYTGQMLAEYEAVTSRDMDTPAGTYLASGTSRAMLSNRISYLFDWRGPSMTIDTACSSSLVALHQAIQQLRSGQSRMAVAAGVNLMMDPRGFLSLGPLSMLSPDGRCKMWDASANGYARGDAIAAIVVKTLKAALEDGDHIECVIRETALNQDGKTKGITAPNPVAQARLIRECYSRAGLDLNVPEHRPQFFECHGTGTLAGDAAEAEAISSAFFPSNQSPHPFQKLLVGSIKTVVGHTEGAAGLAGILRASLALQNATIPPNLLFKNLNPRIKPFYHNINCPLRALPGLLCRVMPLDVSVFGFGGANAHAILENYAHNATFKTIAKVELFTPFVFSAFSRPSLLGYLKRFCLYLETNSNTINMRDLAYTLHSRRTHFQYAVTCAASTAQDLLLQLRHNITEIEKDDAKSSHIKQIRRVDDETSGKPRILGIFTGQGAQWAQMGAQLLINSKPASHIIARLEARLARLPVADRPQWSLREELLKGGKASQIGQASISQPLCTAIQILLVDMLKAAGLEFTAVVGHSSGEIAASYAASFISSEEAICIAYYRGLHAKLASGREPGAMMAVGSSYDDIQELCDDPELRDRVSIAAVNSPASVTVSGDKDAVEWVQVILGDEKKFSRLLKVDTAYHSYHMLSCSSAYLESLGSLNITPVNSNNTLWFSSVLDGQRMDSQQEFLKDKYWDLNMIQPVVFSRAVAEAWKAVGRFDMAIEIGPHPALKGPTLQTTQEFTTESLPYTGLLHRGSSAIESVADGLGKIWAHLGEKAINLHKYDLFVAEGSPCRLLKGLPIYNWDHHEYWTESRQGRAYRLRPGPVHELLGHLTPDSSDQAMYWRHILRPSEVQWINHHKLQGQVVFTAAAYVVTALEAAAAMCQKLQTDPSLIEITNLDIQKALVFELEDAPTEIMISMLEITVSTISLSARFTYHSADARGEGSLGLMAQASVHVTLGEPSTHALPAQTEQPPGMVKIAVDKFYSCASEMGYEWSDAFTGISSCERKLGWAAGTLDIKESSNLICHPTLLDSAFQTINLTLSYPDDGQLRCIQVPRRIRRASFNPHLCVTEIGKGVPLRFLSTHDPDATKTDGSISVYSGASSASNSIIQITGFECVPLVPVTAQDDKEALSTVIWGVAEPDALISSRDIIEKLNTSEHLVNGERLERLACAFLRHLWKSMSSDDLENLGSSQKLLHSFASETVSLVRLGKIPSWKSDWELDDYHEMTSNIEAGRDVTGVDLLQMVCELLALRASGEAPIAEQNQLLVRRFLATAAGPEIYTRVVAEVAGQATHINPHMNVLQIGSGEGPATNSILEKIGPAFASYTFADASPSCVEAAKTSVPQNNQKIFFKKLNIAEDVFKQGFVKESFDMVIVVLSLLTTPDLQASLRNIRNLLKSGGYLIVLESLPQMTVAHRIIMAASAMQNVNWSDVDSVLSTTALSLTQWNKLLLETGFSGCDTVSVKSSTENWFSHLVVFTSRAMNEKLNFLREPLSTDSEELFPKHTLIQDLVILGGETLETHKLVRQIAGLLKPYAGRIRIKSTLAGLADISMSPQTTVLGLSQLDGPFLLDINERDWDTLRLLLMSIGSLFWVTKGRRAESPFGTMMTGLLRSIVREAITLQWQIVDWEHSRAVESYSVVESLLRFQAKVAWLKQGDKIAPIENELVADERDIFHVPRVICNQGMNDRYNSFGRSIVTELDPRITDVYLRPSNSISGYELGNDVLPAPTDGDLKLGMETSHSSLSAIRVTHLDWMFVAIGKQKDSNQKLVALLARNSSRAYSSETLSIKVELQDKDESKLLYLVSNYLLALAATQNSFEGDTILVYEPDEYFVSSLIHVCEEIGVHVKCLTTRHAKIRGKLGDWAVIHQSASDHDLSSIIPQDTSIFIDLSWSEVGDFSNNRLRNLLSPGCRLETAKTLLRSTTKYPSDRRMSGISKRLRQCVDYAISHIKEDSRGKTIPVISIDSLARTPQRPAPVSIIRWHDVFRLSVHVQPIDTQISFSKKKTYWFAGLSKGLGIALCEWMGRRGARYFVISSRSPTIDPVWIEGMRQNGITIKVIPCDITIKDRVAAAHSEIKDTLPPIGGVLQGSMVLHDVGIRDMSLDDWLIGTRPKVLGSLHLNDEFQENNLDFFIFFSSVVAIIGRPGQANYCAPNMFMAALAEQRRRRGLAASIIHIGAVYGVGYATLQEKEIYTRATLGPAGLIPTSERDFYQLFSEGIIVGRPNSGAESIEIVSGVRTIEPNEPGAPAWETEPLMTHHVRNPNQSIGTDASTQAKVPLKVQLTQATSRDQIFDLVTDALIRKLCSVFQIDESNVSQEAFIRKRLDEMGIDSLMAVEIRGWFMKMLEVNIPILKILGGVIVKDLINTATDLIPDRLTPGLPPNESKQKPTPNRDSHLFNGNSLASNDEKPVINSTSSAGNGDRPISNEELLFRNGKHAVNGEVSIKAEKHLSNGEPVSANGVMNEDHSIKNDQPSIHNGERTIVNPAVGGEISRATTNDHIAETDDFNYSADKAPRESFDTATRLPLTNGSASKFIKTSKLSFCQTMFWFVWAFLEDKSSLNHTAWARVTGKVKINDFKSALDSISQRHEILRTCIVEQDGKLIQGIMAKSSLIFETKQAGHEREIFELVNHLQNDWVYDVARGETVKACLLSRSPTEHFFVIGFHPLVADGMTAILMLRQIQQSYMVASQEQSVNKSPIRQYSDFSNQQHSDYSGGRLEADLEFWRTEFASIPPTLPILSVSNVPSRPELHSYINKQAVLRIDKPLKEQVQSICRKHRITPFHFYLAIFRVLLLRFSPTGEGKDVCIGIGDSNRTEDEMMDVLGPFVNLLPLRLCTEGSTTFADLLQLTRRKTLEALSHSKVPFQVLLKELDVTRSSSHTSLFQCFVNYRQGLLNTTTLGNTQDNVKFHSFQVNISKQPYDVSFEMVDYIDGDCVQTLVVREDMYGETGARILLDSYERLLKAFVYDQFSTINQPDLFGKEETQQSLANGTGLLASRQWPETIVHKFEEIAVKLLNNIAVYHMDASYTYGHVLGHTKAISAALRAHGVSLGSVVAVLVEPGFSWVSSVLGVMRAGATYLPLDLSHPLARLSTIIQDALPSVILVDEKYDEDFVNSLKTPQIHILQVPDHSEPRQAVPNLATSRGKSVLFYTSGSTGIPKGVVLNHEGLRNWAEGSTSTFGDLGPQTILQQTSPVFDMSLTQLITSLCFGGTLCILPRQDRADAEAACNMIAKYEVTLTHVTPTELSSWLQHRKMASTRPDKWRMAVCAGEALPSTLVKMASRDHSKINIVNIYGPTEITITCAGMRVPADNAEGPVAAGYPHPNSSVYILDPQLRPVPFGVQGEVYVGGAGIAVGYLNRDKLTTVKFVPNPFAGEEYKASSWTTMHRTGDVGRWRREDGALLIEGRIDAEVKLRGVRIDLAEIEQIILSCDGSLREAAVSLRRLSSAKYDVLIAHVVLDKSSDVSQRIAAIQSQLSVRLPRYMCPAAILPLDKVPLTSSGKLDRRLIATLPLPNRGQSSPSEDKPLSDTEKQLRGIWEDVVGMWQNVTSQTDFFHVGGSSFLLLELKRRIKQAFDVEMPLIRMFEFSTLESMADWIGQGTKQSYRSHAVDWEKEITLPPAFQSLLQIPVPASQQKGTMGGVRVVALTGATGLFGTALVKSLAASPFIRHVHCLGMHDSSDVDIEVADNAKISFEKGDLVLPRLGLSEADATSIFSKVDVVIHNAADRSYLKTYNTLRAANYQSTRELAQMLLQHAPGRPTVFHYISVAAVGNLLSMGQNLPGQRESPRQFGPVSLAKCPPPRMVTSSDVYKTGYGYLCSRWASEVFLEKLCAQAPSLSVVIHRPSAILHKGVEATGVGGLEFVENLRRYASLLGAVPRVPEGLRVSGGFNAVPAEVVVRGVMSSVEQAEGTNRTEFLHHIGDSVLSFENPSSWAGGKPGGEQEKVREIPMDEWLQQAKAAGMHHTVGSLLEDMVVLRGSYVFPKVIS